MAGSAAMTHTTGQKAKRLLPLLVFVVASFSLPAALAQSPNAKKGDRALGEYLSSTCVTCHQISGVQKAGVPAIVGWPEDQFIAILKSYKDKVRENEVMQTATSSLSDEDMAGLATYFGSLKSATPAGSN